MKLFLSSLCLFLFLCLVQMPTVFGQGISIPLNRLEYHNIDRLEILSGYLDTWVHSSAKPYNSFHTVLYAETADDMEVRFRVTDRQNQYYIYRNNNEWTEWGLIESKKPLWKSLYKHKTDFLRLEEKGKLIVRANPLLHMELGQAFGDKGIQFINRRGGEIRGVIGGKVGFYTQFTENQRSFPDYYYEKLVNDSAVPGEGRYALFHSGVGFDQELFSRNGTDYFNAAGHIAFQAMDEIGVELGHGKHFLGNGVRSLFLSDYSANHFYLKFRTNVWKLNYQNLFLELTGQHDYKDFDGLRPKKYAAIHHLSLNVSKKVNIGFFESVVFGRENGFELNYLNPIIFYRAVEFTLGSPDNIMLGMDYKINLLSRLSIYGQFLLDEYSFSKLLSNEGWWGNKFGVQLGLKYLNLFDVNTLDVQAELNLVRPFTYSHDSDIANYSHYNQALAHPLGSNFIEGLGVIRYQPRKDIFLKLNMMYSVQGMNVDTINYGSDILVNSSYIAGSQRTGHSFLQGNQNSIFLTDFTLSWMWKHNLFFDLNFLYRRAKDDLSDTVNNTQMLSLGMRLNLGRKELIF